GLRFGGGLESSLPSRPCRAASGDSGDHRIPLLVDGVARREEGTGALRVGPRVLPADVGEDCRPDDPPSVHPTLPSFAGSSVADQPAPVPCIGRAGNTPELIVHAISLSVANGSWRRESRPMDLSKRVMVGSFSKSSTARSSRLASSQGLGGGA